jgi:hypothetical protein
MRREVREARIEAVAIGASHRAITRHANWIFRVGRRSLAREDRFGIVTRSQHRHRSR